MTSKQPYIYSVQVVGHEAPFKWRLFKRLGETGTKGMVKTKQVVMEQSINGGTVMREKNVDCEGEAQTFIEAMGQAFEAAKDAEWERQHTSTVYEEDLLFIEQHGDPRGGEDEPQNHMTTNYGRSGGDLAWDPNAPRGPEEEK